MPVRAFIFYFFGASRDLHSFPTRRSSDLYGAGAPGSGEPVAGHPHAACLQVVQPREALFLDRKSTRLNSSHMSISYAVFCLKKKIKICVINNIILCTPVNSNSTTQMRKTN